MVEVYPQVNYGQTNPTDFCPTSNYPALFYRGGTYLEWHMTNMDSIGNNFIICGRNKYSLYSMNTNYYNGFLVSYTKGMDLNFLLNIETAYDVSTCYV